MTAGNGSRVLIASGGTGGHIFPAIVFGKDLQAKGHNVEWLCGSRALERTIYNAEGISPVCLPLAGSPLGTKSPAKILGRIIDVFRSIIMSWRLVKNFDAVYLFGGYISFAPLLAAKLRGIPLTLHEQNTVAGKVTRLAEKMGVKILTGWPVCEGIKAFEYAGIPVREPVRLERSAALSRLGLTLRPGAKVIGIAGGSLGSGPLSEKLAETAELCGECEFVFLSSKERRDDGNRHYITPQWDMNPFYSACDVLVCRAGGSTLAEVLKWGMPAIVIAWPGAMDNHQQKNAEEFVKLAGNAHIFSEDDSSQALAEMIRGIMN